LGSVWVRDVKFLCSPRPWGFHNINTLVFALMSYPNRALFIPQSSSPYFITPDLNHHHEARFGYSFLGSP
jgi:hypothetical protein